MSWLSNVLNSVGNFVKKEVSKIPAELGIVEDVLEKGAQLALNLTNALKTFAESTTGQEIEAVIESIVPAELVKGVLAFLPVLVTDLNWAVQEFKKAPADILQEGLQKAVAAVPNVKATNMATLQAHLNTHFTTELGAPMSIQASLSQSPTVYDGVSEAAVTV